MDIFVTISTSLEIHGSIQATTRWIYLLQFLLADVFNVSTVIEVTKCLSRPIEPCPLMSSLTNEHASSNNNPTKPAVSSSIIVESILSSNLSLDNESVYTLQKKKKNKNKNNPKNLYRVQITP